MERKPNLDPPKRSLKMALIAGVTLLALAGALAWVAHRQRPAESAGTVTHSDITTTVFWVGEAADESNGNIHNMSSTWTEDWVGAFGGIDDPNDRCNMLPCGFTPQENPFYAAIPLNDLDESCKAKPWQNEVPGYKGSLSAGGSAIKNEWIKITFDGNIVFAQIQDAGPYGEDDVAYVLRGKRPQAPQAGLDISPATAEYLGLEGRGQTSWEFVTTDEVPNGPWRKVVTTSLPDCAQQ